MTWIARTDGATSGTPTDLRDAELTDVPVAQRGNWRVVTDQPPAYDRLTQQAQRTGVVIAGDGTVSTSWQVTDEPALIKMVRLVNMANAQYIARVESGRVTVLTRELSTSDMSLTMLNNARLTIDRGAASTVNVTMADGEVLAANSTQLNSALSAVEARRVALSTARATIIAAVRAGTLTTTASVVNHAAWSA